MNLIGIDKNLLIRKRKNDLDATDGEVSVHLYLTLK